MATRIKGIRITEDIKKAFEIRKRIAGGFLFTNKIKHKIMPIIKNPNISLLSFLNPIYIGVVKDFFINEMEDELSRDRDIRKARKKEKEKGANVDEIDAIKSSLDIVNNQLFRISNTMSDTDIDYKKRIKGIARALSRENNFLDNKIIRIKENDKKIDVIKEQRLPELIKRRDAIGKFFEDIEKEDKDALKELQDKSRAAVQKAKSLGILEKNEYKGELSDKDYKEFAKIDIDKIVEKGKQKQKQNQELVKKAYDDKIIRGRFNYSLKDVSAYDKIINDAQKKIKKFSKNILKLDNAKRDTSEIKKKKLEQQFLVDNAKMQKEYKIIVETIGFYNTINDNFEKIKEIREGKKTKDKQIKELENIKKEIISERKNLDNYVQENEKLKQEMLQHETEVEDWKHKLSLNLSASKKMKVIRKEREKLQKKRDRLLIELDAFEKDNSDLLQLVKDIKSNTSSLGKLNSIPSYIYLGKDAIYYLFGMNKFTSEDDIDDFYIVKVRIPSAKLKKFYTENEIPVNSINTKKIEFNEVLRVNNIITKDVHLLDINLSNVNNKYIINFVFKDGGILSYKSVKLAGKMFFRISFENKNRNDEKIKEEKIVFKLKGFDKNDQKKSDEILKIMRSKSMTIQEKEILNIKSWSSIFNINESINDYHNFFKKQIIKHLENPLGIILSLRLLINVIRMTIKGLDENNEKNDFLNLGASNSDIIKDMKKVVHQVYAELFNTTSSDVIYLGYTGLIDTIIELGIEEKGIVDSSSFDKKFRIIKSMIKSIEKDVTHRWECSDFKSNFKVGICDELNQLLNTIVGENPAYQQVNKGDFVDLDEIGDENMATPEITYMLKEENIEEEEPIYLKTNLKKDLKNYIKKNVKENKGVSRRVVDLFFGISKSFKGNDKIRSFSLMLLNLLKKIYVNNYYDDEKFKEILENDYKGLWRGIKQFKKEDLDNLEIKVYNLFAFSLIEIGFTNYNLLERIYWLLMEISKIYSYDFTQIDKRKSHKSIRENTLEIRNILLHLDGYMKLSTGKYKGDNISNEESDYEVLSHVFSGSQKSREYKSRLSILKPKEIRKIPRQIDIAKQLLIRAFRYYRTKKKSVINANFIKDVQISIEKDTKRLVRTNANNIPMNLVKAVKFFDGNLGSANEILKPLMVYSKLENISEDFINNINEQIFNRDEGLIPSEVKSRVLGNIKQELFGVNGADNYMEKEDGDINISSALHESQSLSEQILAIIKRGETNYRNLMKEIRTINDDRISIVESTIVAILFEGMGDYIDSILSNLKSKHKKVFKKEFLGIEDKGDYKKNESYEIIFQKIITALSDFSDFSEVVKSKVLPFFTSLDDDILDLTKWEATVFIEGLSELGYDFKSWNFKNLFGNLISKETFTHNIKDSYLSSFIRRPNLSNLYNKISPFVYNVASNGFTQNMQDFENRIAYSLIKSYGNIIKNNIVVDLDDDKLKIAIEKEISNLKIKTKDKSKGLLEAEGKVKQSRKDEIVQHIKEVVAQKLEGGFEQDDFDNLYLEANGYGKRKTLGSEKDVIYYEMRGLHLTGSTSSKRESENIKNDLLSALKLLSLAGTVSRNAGVIVETVKKARMGVISKNNNYLVSGMFKEIYEEWLDTLTEDDKIYALSIIGRSEVKESITNDEEMTDMKEEEMDIEDADKKIKTPYADIELKKMINALLSNPRYKDVWKSTVIDFISRTDNSIDSIEKVLVAVKEMNREKAIQEDNSNYEPLSMMIKIEDLIERPMGIEAIIKTLILTMATDSVIIDNIGKKDNDIAYHKGVINDLLADICSVSTSIWYDVKGTEYERSFVLFYKRILSSAIKSSKFSFFEGIHEELVTDEMKTAVEEAKSNYIDEILTEINGDGVNDYIIETVNVVDKSIESLLNDTRNMKQNIKAFYKLITNPRFLVLFTARDDFKATIKKKIIKLKKSVSDDTLFMVELTKEGKKTIGKLLGNEHELVIFFNKFFPIVSDDKGSIPNDKEKVITLLMESFYEDNDFIIEEEDIKEIENKQKEAERRVAIYSSYADFLEEYFSSFLTQVFFIEKTRNFKATISFFKLDKGINTLNPIYQGSIQKKLDNIKKAFSENEKDAGFTEYINNLIFLLINEANDILITVKEIINSDENSMKSDSINVSFDTLDRRAKLSNLSRFFDIDEIISDINKTLLKTKGEDEKKFKNVDKNSGLVKIANKILKKIFPSRGEQDALLLEPPISKHGILTASYGKTGVIPLEIMGGSVKYLDLNEVYKNKQLKNKSLISLDRNKDRDILKAVFEYRKFQLSVRESHIAAKKNGIIPIIMDAKKLPYSSNKNISNVVGKFFDDTVIFGNYRVENILVHRKMKLFEMFNAGLYDPQDLILQLRKKLKKVAFLDVEQSEYKKSILDSIYALFQIHEQKILIVEKVVSGGTLKEFFVLSRKLEIKKDESKNNDIDFVIMHGDDNQRRLDTVVRNTDVLDIKETEKNVIGGILEKMRVKTSRFINVNTFYREVFERRQKEFEKENKNDELIIALTTYINLANQNERIYYNGDKTFYFGLLPLYVVISEITSKKNFEDKITEYWANHYLNYEEYREDENEKRHFIDKIRLEKGESLESNFSVTDSLINMPFSGNGTKITSGINIDEKIYSVYSRYEIDDSDDSDDFFGERDYKGKMQSRYFIKKFFETKDRKKVSKSELKNTFVKFMMNLYTMLETGQHDIPITSLQEYSDYLELFDKLKILKKEWEDNIKDYFKVFSDEIKTAKGLNAEVERLNELRDDYETIGDLMANEIEFDSIMGDLFAFYVRVSLIKTDVFKMSDKDESINMDIIDIENLWSKPKTEVMTSIINALNIADFQANRNLKFSTLRYVLDSRNIDLRVKANRDELRDIKAGQTVRLVSSIIDIDTNKNIIPNYKDRPINDFVVLLSYRSKNADAKTIPYNILIAVDDLQEITNDSFNYPSDILAINLDEFEKYFNMIMIDQ